MLAGSRARVAASEAVMVHAAVADSWERGSPYERYVGRWSRRVAPRFLSWLALPAGRRWLDVGCGTGALCAAIVEHCAPASVAGVEPSAGFLQLAKTALGARVALYPGDAAHIPLADGSVDAVVSGLVLNFVPDPQAALTEMRRVSAADGVIAAYVWDYAGGMAPIRHFWDAAVAVDAAAAALDEGVRFAQYQPAHLEALFAAAGLQAVRSTAIEIPAVFSDFDDYWQPFLGGQGPAPAYAMALDPDARARLQARLQQCLPTAADGSIRLTARAWAVCATIPRAA